MTTFRASAARARRGVRDRLPAKRRAVPANKKVEPRAALARLLLPLLLLPAALAAQGDALRAPRHDVSLAGEPFLATTITKPLPLDATGTNPRVRASGLPEQGLGFRVREDLPAATFVAWLRTANIAPDATSVVFLFTALPIVRDRAPAKAYLRVPQGIGPVTFQGYAQAAGADAGGIGWAHAVLASDAACVLDLGGGQAVTNAPGQTLALTLRAKEGGDVTLSAPTNAVWSLGLYKPRIRRTYGTVAAHTPSGKGAAAPASGDWCMVACTFAVDAAGTLQGRRTIWAQGADEPAEAHAFAIGLDGADALPGPATIIPFQMCTLWGAANSSIAPDEDTAPIHAWGKKMWRRALTDAQLRDVFQTDLAALKAKGLAGGKAANRKSRIVNRESVHPKPLAVPRAPARQNLHQSAQSAFSPVGPSAAADP